VRRGRWPTGRGPVRVAVGTPVPIARDGSRRERAAETTLRTERAIRSLLAPLVERHPEGGGGAAADDDRADHYRSAATDTAEERT